MFNNLTRPMSPREGQQYIWLAEYINDYISEFNLEDGNIENQFKSINKDKIVRFGLVGNGHKMWFETKGGTFNLFGKRFNFYFEEENGEKINLTSNGSMFNNDIITYKQAYAEQANDGSQTLRSRIIGYYFGYKAQLDVNNTLIHFKPIMSLEVNKPAFIDFSISFDRDIKGKFVITRNNEVIQEFGGEFKKNKTNNLKWQLKLN